MLRVGLALGSTSVRAALLNPRSTTLGATSGVFIPCRTMAKKQEATKKQRYQVKEKIKHERVISGLRHKRVSWLDSPRLKTKGRKKPSKDALRRSLNTDARTKRDVNKLQNEHKEKPYKKLDQVWVRIIADQGRISSETAEELTSFVFLNSEINTDILVPATYERFLELWHRCKNLDRAKLVFDTMRVADKLTDKAYSLYCKCLAARGQLDKAKELLEERKQDTSLEGGETVRVMVYYVARDNIEEGTRLFEEWRVFRRNAQQVIESHRKQKKREKKQYWEEFERETEQKKRELEREIEQNEQEGKAEQNEQEGKAEQMEQKRTEEKSDAETGSGDEWAAIPTPEQLRAAKQVAKKDNEMYSMIIGWLLKNDKLDQAEEYFEERLQQQLKGCPSFSDEVFDMLVRRHLWSLEKRNKAIAQYEEHIRKLKENPNPDVYNKAINSGTLKKPRITVPDYPVRYTKGEYIKKFPVVFNSHVLRPLIDMEVAGKELNPTWMKRIADGLKYDMARPGIRMTARKIQAGGDMKRYEALRNLLKKMDLPYEELTFIQPKVKRPEPVKKVPVIKKWWKLGEKKMNS